MQINQNYFIRWKNDDPTTNQIETNLLKGLTVFGHKYDDEVSTFDRCNRDKDNACVYVALTYILKVLARKTSNQKKIIYFMEHI